jgi:hypothetical protein
MGSAEEKQELQLTAAGGQLTHGMSPLSDPPVAWEKQLCAQSSQIYFIEDPQVDIAYAHV